MPNIVNRYGKPTGKTAAEVIESASKVAAENKKVLEPLNQARNSMIDDGGGPKLPSWKNPKNRKKIEPKVTPSHGLDRSRRAKNIA